ncbi:MAG: PQQ-binding-like beta-propeller repeat protein [Gaiellaceae bacterium]
MRLALAAAALVAALAAEVACAGSSSAMPAGMDWGRFDYDAARSGSAPGSGITAQNISKLHRLTVRLDGTVDSSPIYLHDVRVRGGTHDTFFVTTTYGRTEAIDAGSGHVLWRFTPPRYSQLAGSAQITNATPAASTDRSAIYAAAPDGRIRKLRVSDGKVLWTTAITRDPTHEKITSSLNVSRGLVIATTGGYIGDAPPYQGHVVTMSERTGRIAHVWNSLCSNRKGLILPRTCPSSDSAIWSRSGAAVDPATGDLVVATGNAPWDGRTDWGDSVLVLSPDASRLLRHYTPASYRRLNDADLDLGSTSPALLPNGYAVQGGKDGVLRLLRLHRLPGVNARTGGELQTLPAPGPTDVFTAPAVWRGTWVFVATSAGTEALRLRAGRLHRVWSNATGGTSPVVAGSLLYVAGDGALHVYAPASGREVATLPAGPVHWQSPIVADGRIAVAEGNANEHATSGVLDIYAR